MELTPTSTLGEIVRENLSTTRVFEENGLDYCCGGNQSLEQACKEADRNIDEVLVARGAALQAPGAEGAIDFGRLGLEDLASHILETHHVYAKRELERLPRLLEKVCGVHGERHPELLEIRQQFETLKKELEPHIWKEEQVLFPYIRGLGEAQRNGQGAPPSCFGTIQNPVNMMRIEHEAAGEALANLRKKSGGYQAPEDACVSYRALYDALETFEKDLHQHIHLENNILFPGAIELEEQGSGLPAGEGAPSGACGH